MKTINRQIAASAAESTGHNASGSDPGESVRQSLNTAVRILTFALFIMALAGFLLFRMTDRANSTPSTLWSFLNSDFANLVFVGIGLPLIVLLIETRLPLIESWLKASHDRQAAHAEERKQRRLDTVRQTQELFESLYMVAAQVSTLSLANIHRIEDLQTEASRLTTSGNHAIFMWGPSLGIDRSQRELSVQVLNTTLRLIQRVAQRIRDEAVVLSGSRTNSMGYVLPDLQHSLDAIWNTIKWATHHRIIGLLSIRMQLLELQERGGDDSSGELQQEAAELLKGLEGWVAELKSAERRAEELCNIPVELQVSCAELRAWNDRTGGTLPYREYTNLDVLRSHYRAHMAEKLWTITPWDETDECIKIVADRLRFERFLRSSCKNSSIGPQAGHL